MKVNSRAYSEWWLRGERYQIFQWMWHPSGSVKYWSLPPFKIEKSKARPKKVIMKLSKRKDVFNILQRKEKLKSIDITEVGLPQGSLVFINQSLYS